MHIVFRCDSTKHQGLGHVFRAVSVADAAVAAGHTVEFLARIESEVGRRLLSDHSFEVTVPESTEAAWVAEWAAERRADVLHVDTYESQGPLRAELDDRGILLSSLEDGPWGRRPADVVVDPSAGAENAYRPWDGSARLLRGLTAIPLRSEILADLEAAEVRRAEFERTGGPLRVLIVMGGTDARNMTSVVAGWWADAGVESTTTLVSAREDLDVPGMTVVKPGPGIARSFAEMDLVLSGAGTTMWELAALGVPQGVVQLVDNQADNYSFAASSRMAAGLGSVAGLGDDEFDAVDLPPAERAAAVETLRRLGTDAQARREMAQTGRALVDGRGGQRIVELWAEAVQARAGDVSARRATIDDASVLFDWRNDPSVRAVSREKGELKWDSHVAWLKGTLARADRELWIVRRGGEPVGTLRFDELVPGEWEVSITVAPTSRGRGLAGVFLAETERAFARSRSGEVRLVAEMLEENAASRRLFESNGYSGGLKDEGAEERWFRLTKTLQA
ncbi:bifunctional UDP-2,4-diacetamido-2,4,6-trideoxy-beta-L-altropyranose hydrolase/GNAT family N-acetyltransferase [Falsarthrobacter nasiphocae]|uniref:Spore coat polysaccharide biosynthesis predicted glycosyltransferase SpsG/RimJ/RimL family protein N-acetyltransferase n=1 Tax=Falsarthrobacter nasiphocae TaxID=189863 RepID=A0AAE3YG53_9MICC|nr:bifunctional UDP-2,4-diacetamido-2,4,6-trideoxy-beta-L-altropyranose hydrolase/GNAT family N-acetyltransferase [Falsarthrobacter nasiphocae]MDR6891401.1 spore coat polysaccharide biosynthesis predicted glycosyltransferase SpsG/RimJ/RimL family protein N-acetyltransferase [Falsarthrobacter nasiphocae]